MCVRACVRACVCACVRTCVRACVRTCVCVCPNTLFWQYAQLEVYTVEPLNKGPIGVSRYVSYLEVSFTGSLNNNFLIIIILTGAIGNGTEA